MPRHRGEAFGGPGPAGFGWVGRALFGVLAWFHRRLAVPFESLAGSAAGRMWRIRRSRRWLMCWALGALVLLVTGLVLGLTARAAMRDHALVASQSTIRGILLEDDYAGCLMRIAVGEQEVLAESSCNTNNTFPARTPVSIIQDPERADRFLVVSPGQDWRQATAEDLWVGIATGLVAALLLVWLGHFLLLHPARPRSPLDAQEPEQSNGPRGPVPGKTVSAALDGFAASWDAGKDAIAASRANLVDLRIGARATLCAVLVLAVTSACWMLGAQTNTQLRHDRYLAKTEPVVRGTLIEIGDKGRNPTIRFGTKAVELAYGLRWELFRQEGEAIDVVEDPRQARRLVPVEIADPAGPAGMLLDQVPTLALWSTAVGFLGWMFIPAELAAAGAHLGLRWRRGDPPGRH